jgi:hypothetical protein
MKTHFCPVEQTTIDFMDECNWCGEKEMLIKNGMVPDVVAKQIEDIVDDFDFEVVKKVMDFLDWQWVDADEGIPRIGELRKKARLLLSEVAVKVLLSAEIEADYNIATGGFRASAHKYDDKVYLKLSFELTECDNYD